MIGSMAWKCDCFAWVLVYVVCRVACMKLQCMLGMTWALVDDADIRTHLPSELDVYIGLGKSTYYRSILCST